MNLSSRFNSPLKLFIDPMALIREVS